MSLLLLRPWTRVQESLSHLSVALLDSTPLTVSLAQPIEILLESWVGVRNHKRAYDHSVVVSF